VIEREWDDEAAMEAFQAESAVMDMTPAELAERIIHEQSPVAALSITHLARHSIDERVRMSAAKYIVDTSLKLRERDKEKDVDKLAAMMEQFTDMDAG
jgi:RNase H-fold protein (predicted Holliday junction resolvase)